MMFNTNHLKKSILAGWSLILISLLACSPGFFSAPEPTATPTKTPKTTPLVQVAPTNTPAPPTDTPTATPVPPTDTPAPTDTPVPTDTPAPQDTATPEPTPTEIPPTNTPAPPADTPTPEPPTPTPEPDVAYKIVHYKVLGKGENNGGVLNKGGQHLIFLKVIDANGNGIDGAIIKDANENPLEVITGDKGPGGAEIVMNWDPYKLYVAADPNGPTTSEVSNQMNNAFPHLPDIVGKLGGLDDEYSICPTIEVRCEPPFYSHHFSYEITFQRNY